jgi:thioesterase domain-containing protein
MAAAYVEALLAFQPQGPYLLAGSSLGGVLAFEMARELRAKGRDVAFLGLLDAPDPAWFRPTEADLEAEAEFVLLNYMTQGKPPFSREQLGELAPEERLDLILKLGREAGTLAPSVGLRELGRLVRVVSANRQALRAYSPQPFAASLVYLKAANNPVENQAEAAWSQLALGGVELYPIPGNHLSMHVRPQVQELASRLASCIERALGKSMEEAPVSGSEMPRPDTDDDGGRLDFDS